MKKIFCCPALELFHCLPLWKTVLFVSSRAFSLSTPTFLLSTPAENSEATWKKATKCNKMCKAQKYIPNHSPKLLLPVQGIDKMQFAKNFAFTGLSIFKFYSVDSIKHTVLLKVLLQIFLLVSIKSAVHWKFSRQINFVYCLY